MVRKTAFKRQLQRGFAVEGRTWTRLCIQGQMGMYRQGAGGGGVGGVRVCGPEITKGNIRSKEGGILVN